MEIRIDQKLAACIIVSLLIGGLIGAMIGFVAGHEHEGGRGERNRFGSEVRGQQAPYGRMGYDNRADGETDDDQGGVRNQDEQNSTSTASPTPVQGRTMNVRTPVSNIQP